MSASVSSIASVRAGSGSGMTAVNSNGVNRSTRSRRDNAATVGGLSSSSSRGGAGSSGRSRNGSCGDVFRRCRRSSSRDQGGDRLEMERCVGAQREEASSSNRFSDMLRERKSGFVGALTAAVVAGTVVAGVGPAEEAAMAALPQPPTVTQVKREVRKDVRIIEREIQIDAELIEREAEKDAEELQRLPITLEMFLAKEPPLLVAFLVLIVINGSVGLTWALFVRETSAGPGGEFGKGIVALRKEIVKGILQFFGSIMGSYVTQQGNKSR